MPTAPTIANVRGYCDATLYTDAQIQSAIDTEAASQAKVCRVPASGYSEDLWEALLRRIQRLLEMRSKPLGYQDTATEFGVSQTRVGPDPEIRRLEGPYRRLVLGSGTTEDEETGGDGGGIILDGATYTLEYNAGTAELGDGDPLTINFDTLSDGVIETSPGVYSIPSGLYMAHINDFELSKPDQDRIGQISVPTVGGGSEPIFYPIPVKSSDDFFAHSIATSFMILVTDDFSVILQVGSEAGSGDPLTLGYAFFKLTKVG